MSRRKGGKFVDYKRIESLAESVLSQFGYKGDGAIEIVELAQKEGFVVGEAVLENDSDGMILVNTNVESILGHETQKIILVNRDLDGYFKRFVIAHELGHYFLDDGKKTQNYILAHRDPKVRMDDDHEKEMDYFAACLLMPVEPFKRVCDVGKALFQNDNESMELISLLSNFFKVPKRSVERRLKEVAG